MKVSAVQPMSLEHNVSINVIDERTGRLVQHHEGHNAATNSMIVGIGKYLTGEGVFNQGRTMLANYIPQYISLGTLGLYSQNQDSAGLPSGIGVDPSLTEEENFAIYMAQNPGYGADGYNVNLNNSRAVFGLGYPYTNYEPTTSYAYDELCMYMGGLYRCISENGTSGYWNSACWELVTGPDLPDPTGPHFGELITPTFPRARISYREVVPEPYSELPCTIDVIFSAMISTGALRQFRYGNNDYIFITEAGLWSRPLWDNSGANGLIAGYRIAPPDQNNWAMTADAVTDEQAAAYIQEHPGTSISDAKIAIAAINRQLLKQNIIRVGKNQVVQVVWKVQLGSIEQFGGLSTFYKEYYNIQWEYGLA